MDGSQRLSPAEIALARKRRLTAMHLQIIDGNPLSADQVAMFEMFEREAWTHEQCHAYILASRMKVPNQVDSFHFTQECD